MAGAGRRHEHWAVGPFLAQHLGSSKHTHLCELPVRSGEKPLNGILSRKPLRAVPEPNSYGFEQKEFIVPGE